MLKIGYLKLNNPLAIISSDGSGYLGSFDGSAGLIMLGRFNLDEISPSEIKRAIDRVSTRSARGFSVVGGGLEELAEAAEMAAREGHLMEVELPRNEGICDLVGPVKNAGAVLSVRASRDAVEDLGSLARELREAGADLLHLDLRGLGPAALKVVKKVSDAGAPPLVVRFDLGDFEGARDVLSMGADIISLSENADPDFVAWLADTLKRFYEIVGWYNAPKHICSGGDLRGMAFCCPPVKNCPLLGALKKIGVTPQEFVKRKLELTRDTPLEPGEGTCFGSLAWCCKITKPCFMRDAVLDRHGISPDEYMRLKKKLAEDLLKA
ncbi:methanogenesis marker 9 domain-containing protein [Methanocrinis sp.]|uniref:methanogenesis marker 9 domain-containing protein n=1 Tax=Methanocrinis sp. TaxID=3101522 RepID=UPI003D0A23A8